MYIDIHNHCLYGVDDGAESFEESVEMLKEACRQQAAAVVLTPHYRHGMFAYPKEEIEKNFKILKSAAEDMGLDIYLGCEYHVNSHIVEALNQERCHALADGDYVLTEYSYETEYSYIMQYTQQLISNGYIPVIAHVERYGCLLKKPKLCCELSDMGAMIQMNADSVLGLDGKVAERFCKKMLKNEWADIIASDAHGMKNRANHMSQCYMHVAKKYGESYAKRLFYLNPGKIIQDVTE